MHLFIASSWLLWDTCWSPLYGCIRR